MTKLSHALRSALLAAALAPVGVLAGPMTLKGDVTVARDTLTLGDLVAEAPPGLDETPLFRAPGLGQSGTIQARRIQAAAEALGLASPETGGRAQVTVTRAARQIGAAEIEATLRQALARQHGLEAATTGIRFDGPVPTLVAEPGARGEAQVADLAFDPRTRRVAGTVYLGPSPSERLAQVKVAGSAVELVEVALLGRALDRGETVKSSDIALERRPRESVPSEAVFDGWPMTGRVARRPLSAGSMLRPGDLIRPEIVGRGELVTVVYEVPGVSLSLRAKTTEGGALGDTVGIVNPQSKKALQGIVVGPGRVSVSAGSPGRVAAAQ